MASKQVVIEEQGLRDGLQNEYKILPTDQKIEIIDALLAAGLRRIQVTSFVSPKYVPQMADADALCRRLKRLGGVIYSGLVLNVKGIERAAAVGLEHVAVSISASDTHSRKNTNMSLVEARRNFGQMVKMGKKFGLTIRGGLQCVFGCRFEGAIKPKCISDIIKEQLDLGIDELALADSTGMANPDSIKRICEPIIALIGDRPLFLHLHDTEGKGLANALSALQIGISHFDTAFGGMGGCPFIKGASGNIATEDLAFMFQQMGVDTGIDILRIAAVSRSLEKFYQKAFSGKMHNMIGRQDIKIIEAPL